MTIPPGNSMNDLDWLAGNRFKELIRYEYTWTLAFDDSVSVTIGCLWRLIENGRIRLTSRDDGHKFGLPSPVDVVLELNRMLAGANCSSAVLHEGTLDLEIRFDTGHAIQLVTDSSGYEAWAVNEPGRQFIAVGGGNLTVFCSTSDS